MSRNGSSSLSPSPRDVYVLTVGLLAGLVLGPGVLGWVHAGSYDRLFVGVGSALHEQLRESATTYAVSRDRLAATGVTGEALDELEQQHLAEVQPIAAEIAGRYEARLALLRSIMSATVIAVLAVMVIEAVVTPSRQAGLATARYALLAVWVAVALAQPRLVADLPVVLTAGLIVVALAAGLMPLGRGRGAGGDG